MKAAPRHIAFIMDGNGRWAKARGLPRAKGHAEGAETVRRVVNLCRKYGVKFVTLYAFSTENWSRPAAEVAALMTLLSRYLSEQEKEFHENRIRFRVIGRRGDLPAPIRKKISALEEATRDYSDANLTLALSYGGREELANAARKLAEDVLAGKIKPAEIDEKAIAANLYAPEVPDPDLIVRTSGEMRISNFLLWEGAYSELYVTPTLWPDFMEEDFVAALDSFAARNRRFGGVESKEEENT